MRVKERGSASETDPLIPKESRWWRTISVAQSALLCLMLVVAAFCMNLRGLDRESPTDEHTPAPLGASPLSVEPHHTEVNECERQADGSLRVNSVGTGKTQNACSIQGRGSHSGCFARLPNISD